MSILQGGVSLKRFLVLGPIPDEADLVKALETHRYRPFEDGLEEERMGWCDWRNLLITPPDPDWVMQDRFAMIGLRIDTRKVPATLLKAFVALRVETLIKEKNLQMLSKEAHIAIQDEVKAELLRKVLPTPKVVEVAWDLKGGILWTTAGSGKSQSALIEIFIKSFGIELQPLVPLPLAARLAPELSTEFLMAMDPMNFKQEEATVSMTPD